MDRVRACGPHARPAPCAPRRPTNRPRRRPPAAAGWRIVCPPAPPSAPCWMQYWLRRRQRLEALTPPGAGGVHEGQQVSFADLRGYERRQRPVSATADAIQSITANTLPRDTPARPSSLASAQRGTVRSGATVTDEAKRQAHTRCRGSEAASGFAKLPLPSRRTERRTRATGVPHEGGCVRDAQRLRGAEERKAGRPARRRSLRASSSCFAATVRAE